MGRDAYSRLSSVALLLLAYRVISTLSYGCSNQSPRWRDLGGDYCFIIEENNTVIWIDAVYQCAIEGGTLASFHSRNDTQRVVDDVQDPTKRLHIGLWKRSDGTFEWVDKSAVDFTNWYPGEPNLGFERCSEVYAESGKWNDVVCTEEFGYVCSSPKNRDLSAFSEKRQCPRNSADWQDFGGEFCYIIEGEHKTTWDDAYDRCTDAGGFLASFHSFEDISRVVQRTKSYGEGFHIGLLRSGQGTYKWVDGSPNDLDYFNVWHSARRDEKCASMSGSTGEWYTVPCQGVSGYICSIPKVATCGNDITGEWGSIDSPNYPHEYGPNERCVWRITVPVGGRVFLEFFDFQIDNTFNCEGDFVEVLDGHEATSPVLGKFCGYGIPESLSSSGNKMTVRFASDGSMDADGFHARFERRAGSCGEVISTETGVITSPNFPRPYRANENCIWEIRAPENHRIFLQFQTFEIEGGFNCMYDSVAIRDGLEPNSPILGKFCGDIYPSVIASSANNMAITFTTDGSDQRTGFKAIFRAKDISNYVSLESALGNLFKFVSPEKVQLAKKRVFHQTAQKSEDKKNSKLGPKKAMNAVLQQL